MAQFAIENLTFSYPTDPEHPSLQEISLQVEQGEYIALCGKSGSGKTTLLRHLKTVLTPHGNRTGSIFYEGAPLDQADLRKQSSEIGFVKGQHFFQHQCGSIDHGHYQCCTAAFPKT